MTEAEPQTLTISRLGAQGDGIADTPGGPVYVPYALPGETVRAAVTGDRARLMSVDVPSPDRVAPVCPYFTRCGGCVAQHMAPAAYAGWKTEQVATAFRMRGLEVAPAPLLSVGLGARRRVTLAAERGHVNAAERGHVNAAERGHVNAAERGGEMGVRLGFHTAGTHDIIDIAECPIASPRIVAALGGLRTLVEPLLPRREAVRVAVTACDNGLDVDVAGVSRELKADLRARLAADAGAAGLVRLSVDGDPLIAMASPSVACAGVAVTPAPGAFLQASASAEACMAELILGALPKKAKQVADLFCGLGAFSFALARRAAVAAYDGDAAAIATLQEAQRHTQGLKPITAKVRDLFREPLSRRELDGFDAVVLDPPRAGAKDQAEMLAKSKVGTVIAVSCNPATLARDVRILVDGGYKLGAVTPIDQFLFSAHVEAVAVLRR